MSNLVPPDKIEQIVGVRRHKRKHYGRAVSREQMVYVLHSRQCLSDYADLRECPFSQALDNGLDLDKWQYHQDEPVELGIVDDSLWPVE